MNQEQLLEIAIKKATHQWDNVETGETIFEFTKKDLTQLITTLSEHHEAEVERAVEAERERILNELRPNRFRDNMMDDECESWNVDWQDVLQALTPTKTDKQSVTPFTDAAIKLANKVMELDTKDVVLAPTKKDKQV